MAKITKEDIFSKKYLLRLRMLMLLSIEFKNDTNNTSIYNRIVKINEFLTKKDSEIGIKTSPYGNYYGKG